MMEICIFVIYAPTIDISYTCNKLPRYVSIEAIGKFSSQTDIYTSIELGRYKHFSPPLGWKQWRQTLKMKGILAICLMHVRMLRFSKTQRHFEARDLNKRNQAKNTAIDYRFNLVGRGFFDLQMQFCNHYPVSRTYVQWLTRVCSWIQFIKKATSTFLYFFHQVSPKHVPINLIYFFLFDFKSFDDEFYPSHWAKLAPLALESYSKTLHDPHYPPGRDALGTCARTRTYAHTC